MQTCRTCGQVAEVGERVTTVMREVKVKGRVKAVPVDFCKHCGGIPGVHRKVSTFPFTLPFGLDGSKKPLVVNSLYDLRKKERQYGVSCQAYSTEERRFNEPPAHRAQPSW
jgi:hypothetical protein